MPIFISYSHEDKEFVDKLALQLMQARAPIWLDRWELRVGDSLIEKVQAAIQGASALLVILSRASVESPWCRRELNAALVRELEEKSVLVLPVLKEDCDIPLFLREKLYADFRNDYDQGLDQVLTAAARFFSDTRNRIKGPDANVDWALDWTLAEDGLRFTLTMLQHNPGLPYTVLVQVHASVNDTMTRRFVRYAAEGFDWVYRQVLVELLREAADEHDLRLILADPQPYIRTFGVRDSARDMQLDAVASGRVLGQDTGFDLVLEMGPMFGAVLSSMREHSREVTQEEALRMQAIAREISAA